MAPRPSESNITFSAMNKIAKFDEGDYRTWVTDPIRKRAVYHFMEQIGELVNRLHYKRDIDLDEEDALFEWGHPTALYRSIRNLMAHNPHRAFKFPGMKAGAYEHLYTAITEAFAELDGIVEVLKLVKQTISSCYPTLRSGMSCQTSMLGIRPSQPELISGRLSLIFKLQYGHLASYGEYLEMVLSAETDGIQAVEALIENVTAQDLLSEQDLEDLTFGLSAIEEWIIEKTARTNAADEVIQGREAELLGELGTEQALAELEDRYWPVCAVASSGHSGIRLGDPAIVFARQYHSLMGTIGKSLLAKLCKIDNGVAGEWQAVTKLESWGKTLIYFIQEHGKAKNEHATTMRHSSEDAGTWTVDEERMLRLYLDGSKDGKTTEGTKRWIFAVSVEAWWVKVTRLAEAFEERRFERSTDTGASAYEIATRLLDQADYLEHHFPTIYKDAKPPSQEDVTKLAEYHELMHEVYEYIYRSAMDKHDQNEERCRKHVVAISVARAEQHRCALDDQRLVQQKSGPCKDHGILSDSHGGRVRGSSSDWHYSDPGGLSHISSGSRSDVSALLTLPHF
ncbi:hypothetical protein SeLEV6574_g01436 [Synchytrium endobioticum]|uniref:Uncharacterized protein n=1 Tax=Synchytrium endobioticum TaxID=286115 RepID=A0A507DD82_9FUNG|nr:hypothetical protein SeLEV6574_g01436 [Synchytrium endobioticum]